MASASGVKARGQRRDASFQGAVEHNAAVSVAVWTGHAVASTSGVTQRHGHAPTRACLGWCCRGGDEALGSDVDNDAMRLWQCSEPLSSSVIVGGCRVRHSGLRRRLDGACRGIHLWRHPEAWARSHKGVPRVALSWLP